MKRSRVSKGEIKNNTKEQNIDIHSELQLIVGKPIKGRNGRAEKARNGMPERVKAAFDRITQEKEGDRYG